MSQTDDLNRRAAIGSFVFLGTLGVLSFIVQPALIQGFVTVLHLPEDRAVDLAGVEMMGVAAATIVLALIGERISWRVLTALAITLAVIGNLWSAVSLGQPALWSARAVAGFGHGGLISLSFTFVGLTRRVDRNVAIYLVSLLSYGALGIWAAPYLFAHGGLRPVFVAFALLTAVGAVTLRHVPVSSAMRQHVAPRARALTLAMRGTALASVLFYNIAQGIAWAILFLVGTHAGLAEQPVADALFASQVTAVAGAVAAVYLAERWRRTPAIVAGILGGAACIVLMLGPLPLLTYTIAVCGFNLLWNFVLPFILGALADMDLKGRMMSLAIAMQMIGLGLGPILTGALIRDGNLARPEWVCIAAFLASLLLIAPPLRAHRRACAAPAVA